VANQIGLDAGLMSAAACGCWVGQCLALPAMIARDRSDSHAYTRHTLLGTCTWWFHHLDQLGRSGHGEDIDHVNILSCHLYFL
jgi:hypothetical protein